MCSCVVKSYGKFGHVDGQIANTLLQQSVVNINMFSATRIVTELYVHGGSQHGELTSKHLLI